MVLVLGPNRGTSICGLLVRWSVVARFVRFFFLLFVRLMSFVRTYNIILYHKPYDKNENNPESGMTRVFVT